MSQKRTTLTIWANTHIPIIPKGRRRSQQAMALKVVQITASWNKQASLHKLMNESFQLTRVSCVCCCCQQTNGLQRLISSKLAILIWVPVRDARVRRIANWDANPSTDPAVPRNLLIDHVWQMLRRPAALQSIADLAAHCNFFVYHAMTTADTRRLRRGTPQRWQKQSTDLAAHCNFSINHAMTTATRRLHRGTPQRWQKQSTYLAAHNYNPSITPWPAHCQEAAGARPSNDKEKDLSGLTAHSHQTRHIGLKILHQASCLNPWNAQQASCLQCGFDWQVCRQLTVQVVIDHWSFFISKIHVVYIIGLAADWLSRIDGFTCRRLTFSDCPCWQLLRS